MIYRATRPREEVDVRTDFTYEAFTVSPNVVCQGDVCLVVESHRVSGLGDDQQVRVRAIGPYESGFTGDTPTSEHLFPGGTGGITFSPGQLGGPGRYSLFLDVVPNPYGSPNAPAPIGVTVLHGDHSLRITGSQSFRKVAASPGSGPALDDEGGILSACQGWGGVEDPHNKLVYKRAFCKGSRMTSMSLLGVEVDTRLRQGAQLADALGSGPVSVTVKDIVAGVVDNKSLSVGETHYFPGEGIDLNNAGLICVAWVPPETEIAALHDGDQINFEAQVQLQIECPA